MRKIQDLPRREIAVRMNITEKTVSKHIAEGICALADKFYGEMTSDRRRT